jgi:hypothetical protein
VAEMAHEPSKMGRDELIVKLARQMKVEPTQKIVDMASTLWIEAVDKWKHGKGPKPDVAKYISIAADHAEKVPPAAKS